MNHRLTALLAFTMTLPLLAAAAPDGCEELPPSVDTTADAKGIVGGQETNYEQWQGVVGLYSGMSICTGTLLAPDIVLSAGHCVFYPTEGINYVNKPGDLQLLGGPNMDEFYSYGEKVVKHPLWQGTLWGNPIDLSMIKLATPVKGVNFFGVRQAPSVKIGEKGVIVGYGLSNSNDQMSAGIHRRGDTTVKALDARVMELGNPSSTCQGDSGGPFFTKQDGAWVVTGVTSFGRSNQCSPSGGGYDVNVLTYRKWIKETFAKLAGYELDDAFEVNQDAAFEGEGDGQVQGEGEGEGEGEGQVQGEGEGEGEGEVQGEGQVQGEGDGDGEGETGMNPADNSSSSSSCRVSPRLQHRNFSLLDLTRFL